MHDIDRIRFSVIADPAGEAWFKHMRQLGSKMTAHRMRCIFFVHGTFVGNDPFGIISILQSAGNVLTDFIDSEQLAGFTKHFNDAFNQDAGNYNQENVQLFKQGINQPLTTERFIWSGANYHMARLPGALYLAHRLAQHLRDTGWVEDERILLLGYSHAGQLFALLTLLLEDQETAKSLLPLLEKSKRELLLKDLRIISAAHLDMVTFGTPVRYRWGDYDKYRLLSFINDRHNEVIVDMAGVLNTRDGDYVQHLGIEGTDLPAPDAKIRKQNRLLDEILDNQGQLPIQEMLERLQITQRSVPQVSNQNQFAKTRLVDYLDQADGMPNFVETVFGHGCYTRKETLLFNTDVIVKTFYE